jgi:hypothetical protein
MDTPICARQIPPFIGFVLYFSRVVVRLLEKWTNKAKWREGGDLAGSTISVFNDPAGSPAERRSASEDSSYPRYSTAAAGIGLTDCRWAFVFSRAGKYEIA